MAATISQSRKAPSRSSLTAKAASPKRSVAASPKSPSPLRKPSKRATGARLSPAEKYPKLAKLITYLTGLDRRADLKVLAKLLAELDITRRDILDACIFGERSYRRNTIASSPHFELLALTWRSGHCTPIHDHKGVSCAFRIIEGTGTEVRFNKTPCGSVCPASSTLMTKGYICAAEENDIHQVANHQALGKDLITLHIYSPRITKMNTYEFRVGVGAEGSSSYKRRLPARR